MKAKIRAFIIHALGGVTEAEADARTPYYATNIYWPPRPEKKTYTLLFYIPAHKSPHSISAQALRL